MLCQHKTHQTPEVVLINKPLMAISKQRARSLFDADLHQELAHRVGILETQYTELGTLLQGTRDTLYLVRDTLRTAQDSLKILSYMTLVHEETISQHKDNFQILKLENELVFEEAYDKLRKSGLLSVVCINAAYRANDKIGGNLAISDYYTTINSIMNISSNTMGFNMEGYLIESIEQNIASKLRPRRAKRVNNFVKTLINNPLTETLKQTIPVVNNVVSFISSISFHNGRISEQDVQELIASLSMYLQFYEKLQEFNEKNSVALNLLTAKQQSVNVLLEQYMTERIASIDPGLLTTYPDLPSMAENVFNGVNMEKRVRKHETSEIRKANHYDYVYKLYPPFSLNEIKTIRSILNELHHEYKTYFDATHKKLVTIIKENRDQISQERDMQISNGLEVMPLDDNIFQVTMNELNSGYNMVLENVNTIQIVLNGLEDSYTVLRPTPNLSEMVRSNPNPSEQSDELDN